MWFNIFEKIILRNFTVLLNADIHKCFAAFCVWLMWDLEINQPGCALLVKKISCLQHSEFLYKALSHCDRECVPAVPQLELPAVAHLFLESHEMSYCSMRVQPYCWRSLPWAAQSCSRCHVCLGTILSICVDCGGTRWAGFQFGLLTLRKVKRKSIVFNVSLVNSRV